MRNVFAFFAANVRKRFAFGQSRKMRRRNMNTCIFFDIFRWIFRDRNEASPPCSQQEDSTNTQTTCSESSQLSNESNPAIDDWSKHENF